MSVRSGGRVSDPDRLYLNTSVELPGIPWGLSPSSGDPIMTLGLEQRIETLTQEIMRLEQLVNKLSHQIQSLQPGEVEETPEILDLQPLSRTRVNAQVRRYNEPARLEIIEETEYTDSEDNEG
jgi:hypothetical protein